MNDDREDQFSTEDLEASASTPPEEEPPPGSGFWMRLRVAWAAFRGALRGLPVSLDGKVPLEQEFARQELEKKLAAANAATDDFRATVAGQEAELKARAAALKEVRRELKRAQSAAEETEKKLRRLTEKAEEKERAHDEHLARLEAQLEEQRTELSQRKATVQSLQNDLREAGQQAARQEESLRREAAAWGAQVADRDARLSTLEQDFIRLRSSLERLQEERAEAARLREEAEKQLGPLRADASRREAEVEKLRAELEFLKSERAQVEAEARSRWEQAERREAEAAQRLADAERQQKELRAEIESAWAAAEIAAAQAARSKSEPPLVSAPPPAPASEPAQDEAGGLREHIERFEARLQELEQVQVKLKTLEREHQRKSQQVEVLLGEHGRHTLRADRIEKLLNEFYNEAVSPITVAKATLELMAKPARKGDQENLREVQQTIDQLSQLLAKLRAELAGISES